MTSTNKTDDNNSLVAEFVKLTKDFENKLLILAKTVSDKNLSANEENQVKSELKGTIENINFAIEFISTVCKKNH